MDLNTTQMSSIVPTRSEPSLRAQFSTYSPDELCRDYPAAAALFAASEESGICIDAVSNHRVQVWAGGTHITCFVASAFATQELADFLLADPRVTRVEANGVEVTKPPNRIFVKLPEASTVDDPRRVVCQKGDTEVVVDVRPLLPKPDPSWNVHWECRGVTGSANLCASSQAKARARAFGVLTIGARIVSVNLDPSS